MRHVLLCIRYLHSKNSVHRDLKPENILLEAGKSFDQIKIIDFGLAESMANGHLEEKVGTLAYMAPEVFERDYNEKCDIWSAGVIAFFLLSGIRPFKGETEEAIQASFRKGMPSLEDGVWSGISKEAKDFITKMLK